MKTGIECEGSLSGVRTLFVTAAELRKNVKYVLEFARQAKCPHIYIGANCDFVNAKDLAMLLEQEFLDELVITAEIEVAELENIPHRVAASSIRIIAKFPTMPKIDLSKFNKSLQIKVEDSANCYLAHIDTFKKNETNYLDKTYTETRFAYEP